MLLPDYNYQVPGQGWLCPPWLGCNIIMVLQLPCIVIITSTPVISESLAEAVTGPDRHLGDVVPLLQSLQ